MSSGVMGPAGSGGAGVRGVGEFVLSDKGARRQLVPAGDDSKTGVVEHPQKLFQGKWHLVRIEVFDVVARVDGIHGAAIDGTHVGHGAHQIGLDRLVDIRALVGP